MDAAGGPHSAAPPMKPNLVLFAMPLAWGYPSSDCASNDRSEELGVLEQALTGSPACGNRYLDVGEQCDDGNTVALDGCRTTCSLEREMSIAPEFHKLKNLQSK